MVKNIPQDYLSPRWSGELCDCSMPLTLDTYNHCSYNCLYCFAYFQKGISNINHDIHSVNPNAIKKLFLSALYDKNPKGYSNEIMYYVRNRITMQWGGLGDCFDEYEKRYGVTLELLKFFDEIDYPLSISTKATWWTKDPRYMDIIKKHTHNWHFKISIITLDPMKSYLIEEGVPTPQERLDAIKILSDAGLNVTLRLRPYIIGISEDYPMLIHKANECGANSVSTEFFCVENHRVTEQLPLKYDKISKVVGYDLRQFYRENSKKNIGYHRLNYDLKRPIIENMRKIAHNHKMYFYVSDAHHKEKCDSLCCCGTPPNFKVYEGHYAKALQIAKSNPNHIVYWKDISQYANEIIGHIPIVTAMGFNTSGTRWRAKYRKTKMSEYLRTIWNSPKMPKSPYRYFEGILYPIGKDENGDIIYKYNIKKAKM